MKKYTTKSIIIVGIFLFTITLVFSVALFWPMPKLALPVKFSYVFIKSINVVDVVSGKILTNRDILITGNKINKIDTTGILKVPLNALVVNGSNMFVIPGLWDMHTHSNQFSEWLHHPLYIANGITGVRDMSGQLGKKDSYWVGSQERLGWNSEVLENKRIAPRYLLQSSYQIDGKFSVPVGYPQFFSLQQINDVDSLLQFYHDQKVDFIKVYNRIPAKAYEKLAIEAPKYGMHIAGHKPADVTLKSAILLGQKSFEHGRLFLNTVFRDTIISLLQLMKTKNTYWVPTLQTLKFEANAHNAAFIENLNLKYIAWIQRKLWWTPDVIANRKRNFSKDGKGLSAIFFNSVKKHVKIADSLGVPIMAGTDVSDSYVFPGFSLHEELQELENSRLTSLSALQTATINPSKFVGKENLYGSINPGKVADMVILLKNPLTKIENTKKIFGVLFNGLYYDAKKLEELKEFSANASSSFHINVKLFFSLFNSPLIRVQWAD